MITMNPSPASSPLTQPPSSSTSSNNTQDRPTTTITVDSTPDHSPTPANHPTSTSISSSSSVSPALFGSSSSVFEMTNTNVPSLLRHADRAAAGFPSSDELASVEAVVKKERRRLEASMGVRDGAERMDTDMDVEMNLGLEMQQQQQQDDKEDSPYPFAFAVPDLQPTITLTAASEGQRTDNVNTGYHSTLLPPVVGTNANATMAAAAKKTTSSNNVPPSTVLPGRGSVEQYMPQQQRAKLQEQAWNPANQGNMTRTFDHSQSVDHLFSSTTMLPPPSRVTPNAPTHTRTVEQSQYSDSPRTEYSGLFIPSTANVQGYDDKARVHQEHPVHVPANVHDFGEQRMYPPTEFGHQHNHQYRPERPQQRMYVPVGLTYPLQQVQQSPAFPCKRQDTGGGGATQGLSEPVCNPFIRPTTNDGNHSIGGYVVNEGEGRGGRYSVVSGTTMNGGYGMPFPPSTAASTVLDGATVGGRFYAPLDSQQQRVFTGYGYQPMTSQPYIHHQRQASTDSLLLAHREMEELSTANTTPVFTPSTFPAFLPSASIAYAPSPRPSRNIHGQVQGTAFRDDVEMQESLGPTPSISTERGREETIGASRDRSPSPRRGRRRGETKPGPNFLTKLYAILNDPAYHHMLHWADDGVQIIIRKPKEMEARVLPLVYKQSKFASFSRQLNIYGFMRKVSMRHVDMARDSDVSVWTHYELNRYSSTDKLMSYKRRVGPRHYTRKTGCQAPPTSTKNLFPNGVPAGVRYESIAPPSVSLSPQLVLANATSGMPSCHVVAFDSPYSVSTNTLSDKSLPDTPASVSPTRPIRTNSKSHKMSAGTLPMPSFYGLSSNLIHPSGDGRGVPQNSIMSQHSVRAPSSGNATTSKPAKPEGTVNAYSPTGIMQGGLWQSLLGNAGMSQEPQISNNAQFSSGIFPGLGPSDYSLAHVSFQSLAEPIYKQARETHAHAVNQPMNQMQSTRPSASSTPQQQQTSYSSGPGVATESIARAMHQPSRTLSNSSASSSMLMTPPRQEAIHVKTEKFDQSPVFGSFSLSLGHTSLGDQHGANTSEMDGANGMQQITQNDPENGESMTIAGNQAFASFLHDMGSSPAPSVVELHTEVRPTPVIAVMNASTPQPDKDTVTHEMFINSFETVRPQMTKLPSPSSEMQVVIADIGETEEDMRYLEETYHSRQVKLANERAQQSKESNQVVVKKEARAFDEQEGDGGLRRRGGSFMDKTARQGHYDSAADEFDAWMVVQHTMDD